ncbi:MAG: ABC transporter permease [Halobacteriovoraceae bacterium]|nr:ABC transporter permease [Halobacteriovoraceae bacterium]MBT5094037.1 ABC transporter permease [Halobacteriovoraceae bacterium]
MNTLGHHYWKQIKVLTWAKMKSRYRKTMAGFLWVVMSPILLFVTQAFVFKKILKLEIPNYYLFLLGGLLPWIFITTTMDMCAPALYSSRDLLKAFKIPPFILVCSQILDNFINFLFAFFLVLIPFVVITGTEIGGLLFIPLALFNILLGTTGLVWLLAAMQVFLKDVQFIIPFVTGVLYFITPIFYPIEYVPQQFLWIVKINPFYGIIQPFRLCIYNFSLETFLPALGLGFCFSMCFVILSLIFWRVKRDDFYHYL